MWLDKLILVQMMLKMTRARSHKDSGIGTVRIPCTLLLQGIFLLDGGKT